MMSIKVTEEPLEDIAECESSCTSLTTETCEIPAGPTTGMVATSESDAFQLDLTTLCVIQPTLDACDSEPLVGLEYLLEIIHGNVQGHSVGWASAPGGSSIRSLKTRELQFHENGSQLLPQDSRASSSGNEFKPPEYRCVMCSTRLVSNKVVRHMAGMNHKLRYVWFHFKMFHNSLEMRIHTSKQVILDRLWLAIENNYGRMRPVQCSQDDWGRYRFVQVALKNWHQQPHSNRPLTDVVDNLHIVFESRIDSAVKKMN